MGLVHTQSRDSIVPNPGGQRSLVNKAGDFLSIDDSSLALVVIDETLWRIHKGVLYSSDVIDTSLASSGFLQLLFVVTNEAHLKALFSSTGDFSAYLYENTLTSAAGSSVAAINRNRISSNVATSVVTSGPTVTDKGDALSSIFIPGGSGGNSQGGHSDLFDEFILGAGDYLIELENMNAQASTSFIQLDWYED